MKIQDCLKTERKEVLLVTHAGRFHADDVVSTVILEEFLDWLGINKHNLIRTYRPDFTDNSIGAIVYDIGRGMYDHHQVGDEAKHCIREDGGKYAAVGLIWKELSKIRFDQDDADYIYNSFIRYIDDHDNGNGKNPFSNVIGLFNPPDTASNIEKDNAFREACDFVKVAYDKYLDEIKYRESQRKKLHKYIATHPFESVTRYYLVTDSHYGSVAYEYCRKHGIPFYLYPNPREEGSYTFETISKDPNSQTDHLVDIPEKVRNLEGVQFLHPTRFLGSADSLSRAIEIVNEICTEFYVELLSKQHQESISMKTIENNNQQ